MSANSTTATAITPPTQKTLPTTWSHSAMESVIATIVTDPAAGANFCSVGVRPTVAEPLLRHYGEPHV